MNIGEAYQLIITTLQPVYGKEETAAMALLLLEHYTGTERLQIKLNAGVTINSNAEVSIKKALQQLLEHKPLQYVLEEAWFANMLFYVDENVLIPRPETEELVNWITGKYKTKKHSIDIIEIGTGSGCIAITLKKEIATANITAVDVSNSALEVAKKNAVKLGTVIQFMLVDFLNEGNWNSLGQFNIIVSNPPYIPANEKAKLEVNVADWEPSTALFVPENDPLLFYKKIAAFGKTHLKEGGEIFAECHQEYAAAAKKMFEENGYSCEVKRDIFENERMIRAALLIN